MSKQKRHCYWKSLVGRRFGKLVVTRRAPNRMTHRMWHTRCDCGSEGVRYGSSLDTENSYKIRSCGCVRRTGKDNPNYKHGGVTGKWGRELNSYRAMKSRCENADTPSYRCYGALGITVCERWRGEDGAMNFLADMGRRPEGTSLDRKNVVGNYSPENCRWATLIVQANNKRCSYTPEELAELKKQADAMCWDPLEAEIGRVF